MDTDGNKKRSVTKYDDHSENEMSAEVGSQTGAASE